jgi:Tfp pilus assembly protein PilX
MRNLPARSSGFIMIVTLVILVAMTLLSIGLFRSVDTSTQVANNLGFRQSAIASGDRGVELAISWLQNNKAALTLDVPASGYYATEQAGTDFTGQLTPGDATDDVSWTGDSGSSRRAYPVTTADAAGNKVAYIIQRMCDQTGAYIAGSSIQCAVSNTQVTTGASQGSSSYGSYAITGKTMIYYRITSRTEGLRNTVSYVQTQVLIEY